MLACKLIITIGNILLILAWPVGYILGTIASRSSDAAGRGYAVLTVWAVTVIFTHLVVSVVFAITGYIYWPRMGKLLKILVFSPAWIACGAIVVGIIVGVGIALDWW
jgi:hypothetical protein